MDGWLGESIGGVRSNHKNLVNLYLIVIIQFCLKIYDFKRHPHPMVGWLCGSMGRVRSNQ